MNVLFSFLEHFEECRMMLPAFWAPFGHTLCHFVALALWGKNTKRRARPPSFGQDQKPLCQIMGYCTVRGSGLLNDDSSGPETGAPRDFFRGCET